MDIPPQTPMHRLIDAELAKRDHPPLRRYVLDRADVSWRVITRQIIELTGVDVAERSLTSWFATDTDIQSARAAARQAS